MLKFVVLRLVLLLFFVVAAIFTLRNPQPVNLPDPPELLVGADGCSVSPAKAEVHYGEKGFENAWIQFVNDDNTVQVQTVETKLAILFRLSPQAVKCFYEGWIALVTIEKCVKDPAGRCDFSLPHKVYVRTEPTEILNWKYLE